MNCVCAYEYERHISDPASIRLRRHQQVHWKIGFAGKKYVPLGTVTESTGKNHIPVGTVIGFTGKNHVSVGAIIGFGLNSQNLKFDVDVVLTDRKSKITSRLSLVSTANTRFQI